jgi:pilus assembly protein Flp/PilA
MKNQFLINLIRDERGTSAVEMGLIVGLIVIAMFSALQGFANANMDIWNTVHSKVGASNRQATGG